MKLIYNDGYEHLIVEFDKFNLDNFDPKSVHPQPKEDTQIIDAEFDLSEIAECLLCSDWDDHKWMMNRLTTLWEKYCN
jgi:hypothetical protein